jgi:peptidoglycan/xylan/chitin deacetylase (PgdA/CDA1 family)
VIGSLVRPLSPPGSRAAHQVLLFHRVLPRPDPLLPGDPDRAAFGELLGTLKRYFRIIPLDEAVESMESGTLPGASLSITFDDGYADNFTEALPVLRQHGLTATFFVATGYLDGGRMWNDTVIEAIRRLPEGNLDLATLGLGGHQMTRENRSRIAQTLLRAIKHRDPTDRQRVADAIGQRVKALPDDLMMTRDQVKQMAVAGMQIGAHTVSHPILTRLDGAQAKQELQQSKAELEALTGREVPLFAYPNGKRGHDFDERHAALARECGFRAAFTTEPGVSRHGMDLWQLPRFTPWDRSHGRFMLRLLMNRYGLIR